MSIKKRLIRRIASFATNDLMSIAKEFYNDLNTNEDYKNEFEKAKTFDEVQDLVSRTYDGYGTGFSEIDNIMKSKKFNNDDEACDYFENIMEEISKIVLKMKRDS